MNLQSHGKATHWGYIDSEYLPWKRKLFSGVACKLCRELYWCCFHESSPMLGFSFFSDVSHASDIMLLNWLVHQAELTCNHFFFWSVINDLFECRDFCYIFPGNITHIRETMFNGEDSLVWTSSIKLIQRSAASVTSNMSPVLNSVISLRLCFFKWIINFHLMGINKSL